MARSPDQYPVAGGPSTAEFRDRGSKFVARLAPVRSSEEALAVVEEQRRVHPKCNHHCYAYRLGPGTDSWRANDDGEPSGTAGRPILGQIDKWEVSDVVVVVSRYFGGTKLGTSGLINAYREAARMALASMPVADRKLTASIVLEFGYELMSPVMGALAQLDLDMIDQRFGKDAWVRLEVPRSQLPVTVRAVKAAVSNRYPGEIDPLFQVAGLSITIDED